MTLEQYSELIAKLPEKVKELVGERIVLPAANQMLGSIINRNIRDGKNSDGTVRPNYSTTPGYYSRSQFIQGGAFKPQGKSGNTVKKNGAPNKSMYLPSGYKQLREIQGRDTKVKNYEYTGDTIQAFGNAASENAVLMGFRTERASKIRKGLEAKNGPAFKPTEEEKAAYIKSVQQSTKETQLKIIYGIE